MYRAYRFRLYPTPEQLQALDQISGTVRFVYNLAWEQRRDFWRQYRAATGRNLNSISQGRMVTELRREVDWIRAAPAGALHHALRDLDSAFANFFAGRMRYPTPRRRGINDSFGMQAQCCGLRRINQKWNRIRVPAAGWIKFRQSREIVGRWTRASFSRDALGWHVSLLCEIESEAPANDNPAVGIDRGIAVSLALSSGETFQLPSMAALDLRTRRAKRVLMRRQAGSARRRKALKRLARLSGKVARIRSDWQHRSSISIARRFGMVAIENLEVRKMTAGGRSSQKRGLNRSIQNQGWGTFAFKLGYKLEERGGALIMVDPRYTSQTCSDCGAIDSASRKNQADFACTNCGFALNADHNAAINILRRSTSWTPVEGSGYAPFEAGTSLEAA